MTSQIEISNLVKPLIDTYKLLNAEWKNFFEEGLDEYLQSQTEKYYFTNTFIHRSGKVRFNNIYYPIKASYKELTTDFQNIEEIFDEYSKITIVGMAGSGKTTLLKHIFLKAIEDRWKIPVLIELRNLNDYDGSIEQLITDKVLKLRLKPNDLTFIRALKSGNFLFLFDGYDEIFSAKKQMLIRQIDMFIDAYSSNKFLITTRPGSGIENFTRFYDFNVCSLDNEDVKNFISLIVKDAERRDRITKKITEPIDNAYTEYLRNPLLLSMFILAFESHPEIPKRQSVFYRNVFDTLYSKHDGFSKNSFLRERITNLQKDDFEDILSVFSYLTLPKGHYAFTYEYLVDTLNVVKKYRAYNFYVDDLITDLRTSISLLFLDGFEYYFPHRSMQEYFTALFISKLPSDKKQKAYSNISLEIKTSSQDNSFHFWNLCFEMDEYAFVSHFLIPQLKIIYNHLNQKDGLELIKSYAYLLNPVVIPMNQHILRKIMFIEHLSFFQVSILNFCNIPLSQEVNSFMLNSGCVTEVEIVMKEAKIDNPDARSYYSGVLSIHSRLMNVLLRYGFNTVLIRLKLTIGNKIEQLEHEFEQKTGNIDVLLNL